MNTHSKNRSKFVKDLIRGTKEGKLEWSWYQDAFITHLNYQKGDINRFHVYLRSKSVIITEIISTTRHNENNEFEVDNFKNKSMDELYRYLKTQKKGKEVEYNDLPERVQKAITDFMME